MRTFCSSEDFFDTTYRISGTIRAPVDTMEFTASAAGLGSTYHVQQSLQQDGGWSPNYWYDGNYQRDYDYSYGLLDGVTDTVNVDLLWETTGESRPTLKVELDLEELQAGLGSATGRMALAMQQDRYTASARVVGGLLARVHRSACSARHAPAVDSATTRRTYGSFELAQKDKAKKTDKKAAKSVGYRH